MKIDKSLVIVVIFVVIVLLYVMTLSVSKEIITPPNNTLINEVKPSIHVIEIKDMGFFPSTLTINQGEYVMWKNLDNNNTHSLLSPGKEIKSGKLNYNDNYTLYFDKAGEYDYHCSIRTYLKGKIIVK